MNVFHAIAVARASLPKLTLSQRVVDKMVRNASIYDTETGESLVGFAIKTVGRAEPDLYVLDTIAPDASAIRRGAYFEQGDDLQGDIFNWWYDNWNSYRKQQRGSSAKSASAVWSASKKRPPSGMAGNHSPPAPGRPGAACGSVWPPNEPARPAYRAPLL